MINTLKFKKAGFSFEEISEIIESEKDIKNGNTLNEKEMGHFISFLNNPNKVLR